MLHKNNSKIGKSRQLKKINALMVLCLALSSCSAQDENASEPSGKATSTESVKPQVAEFWPRLSVQVPHDDKLEARIDSIISKMTLEQKIAQMIQPEIRSFTVEDMRRYGFGSYLNGGGSFPQQNKHSTTQDWIDLAESMYQASIDDSLDGSSIPTMWGTDAVHGHNNVIGATLFPHNIGLGAAGNPELIENIATATAKEVMVTGIDWIFAPTVAVARDDRWGRTYESYSEDPEIVKAYSAAIVRGLQGANKEFLDDYRVLATVKHFVGDGGTLNGDDQGNNLASEQELYEIHAQGYVGGLEAGAQTVMASFNSWHGKKNHGNEYLLTAVLKKRMGFDGLVVGDWNGHGQVADCSNQSCSQSINAGLDIFMVPGDNWQKLMANTIDQVKSGEIPMSRIDDAVRRIIRVKIRAGLFDKPSPANRLLSGKTELIGAEEHRQTARQAVRESLVLLKNNNQILPLSQHQKILVAGRGAHNIGMQTGGWSITWQGTGNKNEDFPGATSIYDGINNKLQGADGWVALKENGNFQEKPDVAIVVFGESPYAEGNGDIANLEFQRANKTDLELLRRLQDQSIPVVSVFISGRPLWVNPEINASDAFVAAWLPGSEGSGIADVLFRKKDGNVDFGFHGKLSFSWPRTPYQTMINRHDKDYDPLFPYGFGLTYDKPAQTMAQLKETIEAADVKIEKQDLLSRPWRPSYKNEKKNSLIESSYFEQEAFIYQTFDKEVQEDARRLTFAGKTLAAFELNDNFPFDLRGYAETNSTLNFYYRFKHKPANPVFLNMRCETACDAQIDFKAFHDSTAQDNQWQTAVIDLACFSQQGATMDKIYAPFVIETAGKVTVEIAQVEIQPDNLGNAKLICQGDQSD